VRRTFDLMAELVRALGGNVRRVAITRLEASVFYATIEIDDTQVDARPSDAVNLAVRTGAPIVEVPPGRWASLTGELVRDLHRPPSR